MKLFNSTREGDAAKKAITEDEQTPFDKNQSTIQVLWTLWHYRTHGKGVVHSFKNVFYIRFSSVIVFFFNCCDCDNTAVVSVCFVP